MDKGKSKLYDDDRIFVSLDKDIDEVDLEASFRASFKIKESNPIIIEIDDDSGDDDESEVPSSSKVKKEYQEDYNLNPGPLGKPFVCDICTNSKPMYQSLKIKGCPHFYCCDCIENYVSSKLDNGASNVTCPVSDCSGSLDSEYCKDFLSKEIFIRWGKQLCESLIVAEQRFYCPFKDCSALLVNDGGEFVTRAECPYCYRLFCAVCKAVWHEGILCEEYQKLKDDEKDDGDIMLRSLAKGKGWDRCPKCGFYVELMSGCSSVSCRNCGSGFIYGNGALRKI